MSTIVGTAEPSAPISKPAAEAPDKPAAGADIRYKNINR